MGNIKEEPCDGANFTRSSVRLHAKLARLIEQWAQAPAASWCHTDA
jgi:hypothetical protein